MPRLASSGSPAGRTGGCIGPRFSIAALRSPAVALARRSSHSWPSATGDLARSMSDARHLPVIGIPCCVREINEHIFHVVGEKYIAAVVGIAGGLPLLVPAVGSEVDAADLVARLDGLLLTGSRSNVEPHHYEGPPSRPGTAHDAKRDATTLPLIR